MYANEETGFPLHVWALGIPKILAYFTSSHNLDLTMIQTLRWATSIARTY